MALLGDDKNLGGLADSKGVGYLSPLPLSSLSPSWPPWGEFSLSSPVIMMFLPHQRPQSNGAAGRGLKPLEL